MKTFFIVLLVIILIAIIVRNWQNIVFILVWFFYGLILGLIGLFGLVFIIPFELLKKLFQSLFNIYSEEDLQKNIILRYDKMFLYDNNFKKIKKHALELNKFERKLEKFKEAKKEKQIIKFLNEVKWML